jgi:AcrR family transcriptional regulator
MALRHPAEAPDLLLDKERPVVLFRPPMTPSTTSTRERILQQGLALMSQAGLSGVTLGVLADQVGMSKSGLFAHFRSKEDVQVDLLTHMAEFAMEHVVRPSMTANEGLPRLRAVVRNWFGWAQRAGLPGGCPVAAGLFEFDDVEGRVRNKILEMEGAWRHTLIGLVQRAVELGHLRGDLDVEQFVWELCGIYLGHHAAHRFLRAADADARARTAFRALLDRAIPVRRDRAPTARKRRP